MVKTEVLFSFRYAVNYLILLEKKIFENQFYKGFIIHNV